MCFTSAVFHKNRTMSTLIKTTNRNKTSHLRNPDTLLMLTKSLIIYYNKIKKVSFLGIKNNSPLTYND